MLPEKGDEMELALPRITNYRITVQAREEATLPSLAHQRWLGSVLRGTVGLTLRRAACVTRRKTCHGCAIVSSCVYARFFEQVPGIAVRPGQILHPFALHFPQRPEKVTAGEQLQIELRLIGRASQDIGYFIHALQMALERGLGRERARFDYVDIQARQQPEGPWQAVDTSQEPIIVPPRPERIHVQLQSPLRIKYRKKLVGADQLDARIFLAQVWNRAQALAALPGERVMLPAPEGPAEHSRIVNPRLRWQAIRRYSGRQQTEMRMDGLLGDFALEGEELQAWWPLLWYGQLFQLGRLTSMGLGAYRVGDKLANTDERPGVRHHDRVDEATGGQGSQGCASARDDRAHRDVHLHTPMETT